MKLEMGFKVFLEGLLSTMRVFSQVVEGRRDTNHGRVLVLEKGFQELEELVDDKVVGIFDIFPILGDLGPTWFLPSDQAKGFEALEDELHDTLGVLQLHGSLDDHPPF